MFISDVSQLTPHLKKAVEQNPFLLELQKMEKRHSDCLRVASDMNRRVIDYSKEVENAKRDAKINNDMAKITERGLEKMRKVSDEQSKEKTCEFLDQGRMMKFFESIGMKFVSLSMDGGSSPENAYLRFIRPAKMINNLPVQPMVVRINYRLQNGTFMFYKVKCFYSMKLVSNMHPHIETDGGVCLGNFYDVLEANQASTILESYQDHVLLLDTLLQTYNPDSPYRGINDIIQEVSGSGFSFQSASVDIEHSTTAITIAHSKLNPARSTYQVKDLITRGMYEDFYKTMSTLKLSDVIDDLAAKIATRSHDGDSRDMYDMLFGIYDELIELVSDYGKIAPLSDFSEVDEDEESVIYESEFDTCRKSWLSFLTGLKSNDDFNKATIEFSNLPDLDKAFPPKESN